MAVLVSQELVASQRRVYLRFMDCFGAEQVVSVSLLRGPTPAQKAEAVLADMKAAEDAVKQYASTAGQDLQVQLDAGAAAIAAAQSEAQQKGIGAPAA